MKHINENEINERSGGGYYADKAIAQLEELLKRYLLKLDIKGYIKQLIVNPENVEFVGKAESNTKTIRGMLNFGAGVW